MRDGLQGVTLDTICGGSAGELFLREFEVVLENMKDPNTSAGAKREINLKFVFRVHEDKNGARRESSVAIVPSSKLAPKSEATGRVHLASIGGKVQAFTDDIRQEVLALEEAAEEGVSKLETAREASGGEK